MAGLVGAFLLATTAPFQFDLDPAMIAKRWSLAEWVLFYRNRDGSWSPGQDFIQNLLMLMPLGAAIACAGRRRPVWRVAVETFLVGFALSATAEALQLLVPDRVTQLADVARNAVGCGLAGVVTAAQRRAAATGARVAVRAPRIRRTGRRSCG